MRSRISGLGSENAKFNVYIGNQPDYRFTCSDNGVLPLAPGQIHALGQACGNGWRKVFNVYAKLVYVLPETLSIMDQTYTNWQQYRDLELLQPHSHTALLFTPPDLACEQAMHIVMGRTYAKSLDLPTTVEWLTPEFAVDSKNKLIVCPYFDYRQLSNSKIIYLADLINQQSTPD